MRVLQVAPRYAPRTGGVETHVREIGTRLRERGHSVRVVTADARPGERRRERVDGVPVRRHRALAPGGAFHVAPGVYAAVGGADADVVHAHNYHSLPLAFAAFGADGPFVATPHYHGRSASALRDVLLRAYRPLGCAALRRADRVIAVSEWERRLLAADFDVAAAVVPNGVDVERFRDAVPVDRDRPYVLSVGRLEEYKGVGHLIRAVPRLDPAYDVVVAGDGPDRNRLERLASEAGVADRVEFLGYVTDDELPGLYAGAAAFVTMSSFEAYGLTVGEALAAGTPCVVREERALSAWASRSDCVGVPPDRVGAEGVAAGVRDAVGRRAPAEPLPEWEDVVDRVESVYESVASDS